MKMTRLFAGALLAAVPLVAAPAAQGAVIGTDVPAQVIEAPAGVTQSSAAYAQTILTKVNELRASHGLKPLTRYVQLDAVAQDWSDKQARANLGYWSHRENADARAAYPKSGWKGTWKENVDAVPSTSSDTGAWVFDRWRDSSNHYHAMVDPNINSIGIGFAQSSTGIWYATMNLGIYDSNSTQMTPITTSSSTQPSRSTSNQAKPSTKSALATTTGPSIAVAAIITGLLGTGAFLVMRRRQAS